jgi:hypothetical protein
MQKNHFKPLVIAYNLIFHLIILKRRYFFFMVNRVVMVLLMISLCLGLIPVLASAAPAKQDCIPSVINNPGFEEPAGSGIVGWRYYGPAQTPGYSIQVTQEKSNSGASSLKIDKSGTTSSLGVITDRFAVSPGCTYAAKGKVYLEYGSAMIYLRFFDSVGKQIGDTSASLNSPLKQWTELAVEGIAPAGTARAEILLYMPVSTKSLAYFDDISVQAKKNFELPFEFGAPIITSAIVSGTNGQSYWYVSDATVLLQASDAHSGIALTEYALYVNRRPPATVLQSVYGPTPETQPTEGFVPYNGPIMLTDGEYTLIYRSRDQAGHMEADHHMSVKVDKTGPTVAALLNGILLPAQTSVADAPLIVLTTQSGDYLSGVALTNRSGRHSL